MAITLQDVVQHTRLRHPLFSRENVPNNVLAEALSHYQRELVKMATKRLSSFLVARCSIALNFSDDDTDDAALLETATDFAVVTGVPVRQLHSGTGLDLDADDVAVEDATEELTVSYHQGIQLPEFYKILGGNANYDTSARAGDALGVEFKIVDYAQRTTPPHFPSGYILTGQLFLCGETEDWADYVSIDLRYIPLPANLTALTSAFTLPDMCREALNAGADLTAAEWCAARGLKVDLGYFAASKDQAETRFLDAVSDRSSTVIRTARRNR